MSDSDLKIFIVGPVGAGKTVFATMLWDYVSKNSECGVAFKEGNLKTKKYFEKNYEDLKFRKIEPTSQLASKDELFELKWEGEIEGMSRVLLGFLYGVTRMLGWEWHFKSKVTFDLIDPPGENVAKELKGDETTHKILDRIHNADVVIGLVDLHEHQGDSKDKQIDNAWIIQNTLHHVESVRRVVIAVSKGDLIEDQLPLSAWSDKSSVYDLISTMPRLNFRAYKSQIERQNVQLVVFSAIHKTESVLNNEGCLEKKPKLPLEAVGLDVFVKTILEAHMEKQLEPLKKELVNRTVKSLWFWIGLGLLFAVYLLYWLVRSAF